MKRIITLHVRPEKLAQLEHLQFFATQSLSAMAEEAYQAFKPMIDDHDSEPSSPVSQAAAPPSATESPKRKREEIIIIDEPPPKRVSSYTLLPKDYVEDEESRKLRQQQQLERAREARVYYDKRMLVKLYQAGALSDAWYDRLRILPNGELGDHNGEPLVLRRPASSPSAQAAVSENVHPNVISPHQWKDICIAFDRLPPTWPVYWRQAIDFLRCQYESGQKLSLKRFQSRMYKTKEKYLKRLEEYLILIQPWEDDKMPPAWEDFSKLAEGLQKSLFPLFGIRCYVPNIKPASVPRSWDPDFRRKDRGMKEDVCRLQGGIEAARAFETLMGGNDKTVAGKDRRAAMHAIDGFRGLLHYLERSGNIVINVEDVFGEFYVPLGDMRFGRTEARIRRLYGTVKRDMAG